MILSWLGEAPDMTLKVCNLLGPVLGSKKNYAPESFFYATFSSAAFILEHPAQAQDESGGLYGRSGRRIEGV